MGSISLFNPVEVIYRSSSHRVTPAHDVTPGTPRGNLQLSPSSDLALVEQGPPIQFSSFRSLKQHVAVKAIALKTETENNYIAFDNVHENDFNYIEARRMELGRGVKFSYFGDIHVLIVKVPTEVHEKAGASLGGDLDRLVFSMGISRPEFYPINATKYRGQTGTSKEGDIAYKNLVVRNRKGDWPSIVIESGYSESLARLRADASWWLAHSSGCVKIVLLISVRPETKCITLEKWSTPDQPQTRTSPRFQRPPAPAMEHQICIDPSGITGAPLVLGFAKIFDRNPAPQEHDIQLEAFFLGQWAHWLWVGI